MESDTDNEIGYPVYLSDLKEKFGNGQKRKALVRTRMLIVSLAKKIEGSVLNIANYGKKLEESRKNAHP